MARHGGPVLADTNVILECWRVSAWKALASGYRVETVEDCVIETQTGFQRRRAVQQIDNARLLASLAAVHPVGDRELAAAAVRDPLLSSLDIGERSLWAHALTRSDAWVLCGPDKASLRLGVRLGFRDRLVALETLLSNVGYRPKETLRINYIGKWHAEALNQMVMLERPRRP
jgi:hypothetical protein